MRPHAFKCYHDDCETGEGPHLCYVEGCGDDAAATVHTPATLIQPFCGSSICRFFTGDIIANNGRPLAPCIVHEKPCWWYCTLSEGQVPQYCLTHEKPVKPR